MRVPPRWFILAALLLLPALTTRPALAQETTGRLEGRVLDANGQPIPDVNVTLTSPSLQGGRGCLSTADGTFVVLSLPVGEYRVKLAHLAYQTQVLEGVRIKLGQRTALGDLRLSGRVVDQPEIVVKAERPLIDPTSTEVGGVLRAQDYSVLPIERDYRSAIVLLPQAELSYLGDAVNISGFTGQDNRFFMDGMEVSEPMLGATATALPYNFVEQVELRSGGYEAEFRSALGGTVNAVTYSGGNRTKGSVFGFYTRNRPTADPRYAFKPNTGDYALYDIGAGVGGAIRKDRLWYFLAYNPTFIHEDVEIAGLGFYPDETTTHSFAGKLTWRANDANTVVLTALGDPTVRSAVAQTGFNSGAPVSVANPEVLLTDIRSGGIGVTAEGRSLLGRDLVLKSTLSLARFDYKNVPSTEKGFEELFIVDSTGTWSGGTGSYFDIHSTVVHLGATATWLKGRHEFKGGLEYKDLSTSYDIDANTVVARVDGSYTQYLNVVDFVVGNRIPSAFVQDSWRVSGRLRIHAGLRWDGQYFVGSDGDVAQTILSQWQPRVGVIWEPGRPGTQKLFASAGRFYHDLNSWGLMDFGTYVQSFLNYDHDPRQDPTGATGGLYLQNTIPPAIDGMQGQYFDEVNGGYERQVTGSSRLGATVIYRVQKQGLEGGMNPNTYEYQFNNPGSGKLSDFPRIKHEYAAFALTWQQRAGERLALLASYVLSRNRGNYPGLYASDHGYPFPNGAQFDFVQNLVDAYGLLPNDRTHVFKVSGSYQAGAGVTLGLVAGWQSGTPLSEFGRDPNVIDEVFVTTRGTAGRTPSLWDLSLRVGYQPPLESMGSLRPRITADFIHIGSQEQPVTYDQVHYLSSDGNRNFSDPNPTYRSPTQYQPGPSVRLGAEIAF